jgi:hypothetical protein
MSKKVVQTRSDGPGGKYLGLQFFDTVGEAFAAAREDQNIWKISFDGHRFIRKTEEWSPEAETKIATLLQGHFVHAGVEYSYTPHDPPGSEGTSSRTSPDGTSSRTSSDGTSSRTWWVDQQIFPKELMKRRHQISEEEFERLYLSESIVEVLSNDLFPLRYCMRHY